MMNSLESVAMIGFSLVAVLGIFILLLVIQGWVESSMIQANQVIPSLIERE